MTNQQYIGRFAPSPTGQLHFGSLVTAMASFLEARQNNGQWLLRVDDLDEVRCNKQSEIDILSTLESFGFEWDREVTYQSRTKSYYQDAINQLIQSDRIYSCSCSRKTIAKNGIAGAEGIVYAGTCRYAGLSGDKYALRVKTENDIIQFDDKIAGHIEQQLNREVGDFVIRRADGFTAYQLAVVVDDHETGITHVVRGADLLWSTPRQIYLQNLLNFTSPHYAHIPLVLNCDGSKLSKSDQAHPVNKQNPLLSLLGAWRFLHQDSNQRFPETLSEFWPWAIANWRPTKISTSEY